MAISLALSAGSCGRVATRVSSVSAAESVVAVGVGAGSEDGDGDEISGDTVALRPSLTGGVAVAVCGGSCCGVCGEKMAIPITTTIPAHAVKNHLIPLSDVATVFPTNHTLNPYRSAQRPPQPFNGKGGCVTQSGG